jgi:hypothetical protein
MDGDQGAINKVEHGEFAAALNDVEVSIGKLFKDDVLPDAKLALSTFVSQFATPFGSQALSLGVTAVADAAEGQNIQQIAAAVGPQITADAVTDAEKAGEVTLNAVRVAITAQAASPSSSNASTDMQAGSAGQSASGQ